MAAEAHVSSLWGKQKLFISLFFIGIGLYFFYDGAIGYPRMNRRYAEYARLEKEGGPVKDGVPVAWKEFAKERGWKQTKPKSYIAGAIVEQYVCGGIATTLGVLLLIYWYTHRRRSLRTDGEAVYTPTGTRVPFEAITGIGKKRWESKGLATVRYELEGRKHQFMVDDYKFEQEPTHQVLAEIEEHLVARAGQAATVMNATPEEEGENAA